MRLTISLPVSVQIEQAKANNIPLYFDLRGERMGDKAAAVNVACWLAEEYKVRVILLETDRGKTSFMLRDYVLPEIIELQQLDPEAPLNGLDIHTAQNNDSLWILNTYLRINDIRSQIELTKPVRSLGDVVFGVLSDCEYNQRRDMDVTTIRQTVDLLKSEGFDVTILADRKYDLLPDAVQLTMANAIERIASCAVFIGGDTGFSHVAASFGTPVVALYPDWNSAGIYNQHEAERTAAWFEIPLTIKSFLPNAEDLSVVTFSDRNTWSPDHVLQSVKRLYRVEA